MRNAENILALDALKIDFMGFIFYEKSSRFVHMGVPETQAKKIGVFVNESQENIFQKIKEYNLWGVQLHGDETPEFCKEIKKQKIKTIKVFRVDDDFDFLLTKKYEPHCDYFLFDAKGKKYGGNGIVFNWEILKKYQGEIPFFLSGGISIESVGALNDFHHEKIFALDVNSGFEIKPALKNISQIQQFTQQLKMGN